MLNRSHGAEEGLWTQGARFVKELLICAALSLTPPSPRLCFICSSNSPKTSARLGISLRRQVRATCVWHIVPLLAAFSLHAFENGYLYMEQVSSCICLWPLLTVRSANKVAEPHVLQQTPRSARVTMRDNANSNSDTPIYGGLRRS